jgi:hypothetical protein
MKNFNNNNSCGVVNSRGKPCQRTGFCPFHHKVNRKRQKVENSDEEAFESSKSNHYNICTQNE